MSRRIRKLRTRRNEETNEYDPLPRKRKRKVNPASNIPSMNPEKLHLKLREIQPLTETQSNVFDSWYSGKHMLLHGYPGTGKSFVSLYLMLKDLLDPESDFDKLIIIRSAQQGKDMGFMPGNLEEKTKFYELPYKVIFSDIFGRDDAYEIMKKRGLVEFMSTSFLRGLTFDNALIFVDETQNGERNELIATMTRLGNNSRIIFAGDYGQSDLKNNHKESHRREDVLGFMKVIQAMKSFDTVDFSVDDIVRSGSVKEFIIAAVEQEYI